MVEIGAIVWGVRDLHRAIKFWSEALDYKLGREPGADYVVLADPDGNTFCVVHVQS